MPLNQSYWQQTLTATDSRGDEYCLVPITRFLYGLEQNAVENKAEYYIAKHCVTKAQFKRFLAETGHDYDPGYERVMDVLSPLDGCPATPVSWDDAKAYDRWLRGLTGEYYSLPAEIEWELAARGSDGREWPWGGDFPTFQHANVSLQNASVQTCPVDGNLMGASPYGLRHMAGNVWEWCLDEDEDEEIHVARGGACIGDAYSCMTTSRRFSYISTMRPAYHGFRLIYLPPEKLRQYKMAAMAEARVSDTVSNTVIL